MALDMHSVLPKSNLPPTFEEYSVYSYTTTFLSDVPPQPNVYKQISSYECRLCRQGSNILALEAVSVCTLSSIDKSHWVGFGCMQVDSLCGEKKWWNTLSIVWRQFNNVSEFICNYVFILVIFAYQIGYWTAADFLNIHYPFSIYSVATPGSPDILAVDPRV